MVGGSVIGEAGEEGRNASTRALRRVALWNWWERRTAASGSPSRRGGSLALAPCRKAGGAQPVRRTGEHRTRPQRGRSRPLPHPQRRRRPPRGAPGASSWPRTGHCAPSSASTPPRPTSTSGHTVVLRKLREFQDLGHTVVLIVGDYTARVGDPSGRSATRPQLDGAEIDANAETFKAQAFSVLDPDRTEVRSNGEWLDMPTEDLFRLARTSTVAQLLERDDFAKRYARARADLHPRAALPAAAGLRLGRRGRRRRAGGHRPEVQPAAGARHPAGLRPASPSRS